MLGGAAMVVLDKIEIEPDLAEGVAVPCLEEEAARIAKDFGFEGSMRRGFWWGFFS
jgi:hypothetical protein